MSDIEERKREAVELIMELLEMEFTPRRELEINTRLDKICPDPEYDYDLLLCPETGEPDIRRSAEEAVEKIFAYKPIQLPDRSGEELP